MCRQRAGLDCLLGAHQSGRHPVVLANQPVDLGLDVVELIGRDGFRVGKVEPQPIRCHERAFLGDVIAEPLPERLVQQMGRRMVRTERGPPITVDAELHDVADGERAALHHTDMGMQIVDRLAGRGDPDLDPLGGAVPVPSEPDSGTNIATRSCSPSASMISCGE